MLFRVVVLIIVYFGNAQSKPGVKRTDPEVFMNTSEIIRYHGYACEEHEVHTQDGYILQVQRIPRSRTSTDEAVRRPVVLLQHGLLSCSACWVENLVDESLGFILADAGYDVWLGNSRGNTYGLKHERLTPDQDEFWEFSWDEMARHDLPSTVDYILAATGQTDLYYVGHSQGTEIMFAALAHQWLPADRVRLFAALGPAVYLNHAKSPITLLAGLPEHTLYSVFGRRDFMPQSDILTWLGSKVCSRRLPGLICENVLFLLGGYDFRYMNETRVPVYIGQHPAGSSMQNMVHYAQAVKTGKFQMYDFGRDVNLKKYNSTTPPEYRPDKITTKIAIFAGPNDWLTVVEDIKRLEKQLSNVVMYKVVPNWEHLDFIWATNAPEACYDDIIRLFQSN